MQLPLVDHPVGLEAGALEQTLLYLLRLLDLYPVGAYLGVDLHLLGDVGLCDFRVGPLLQ